MLIVINLHLIQKELYFLIMHIYELIFKQTKNYIFF